MTTSMPSSDTESNTTRRSRLDEVRFTFSVSPALVRGNLDLLSSEHLLNRFRRLAPRIQDINFTHHLDPFLRDAHGVFLTEEENVAHFRQMMALQAATGITVSPVFNNIHVPNTRAMLERFVENVRPLHAQGLRSMTVPHVLWLKMGLIQKAFPDMTLKDTVLRRVRTAQEFWNHAEAGYDYVNIDRVLIRDLDELKQIRAAQRKLERTHGKHVVTALLHAEGCLGNCPLIEEHHQHTLMHEHTTDDIKTSLEVFRLPPEYSCYVVGHPTFNFFMSVGLPFFRKDLEEVCEYFDVVKLAGRRTIYSLGDCLTAAETFCSGEDVLAPGVPEEFRALMGREDLAPQIDRWRRATRNCRFQCWKCDVCSEILARLV